MELFNLLSSVMMAIEFQEMDVINIATINKNEYFLLFLGLLVELQLLLSSLALFLVSLVEVQLLGHLPIHSKL